MGELETAEVEETRLGIRSGGLDPGADHTCRLIVEQMQEGAATLSEEGLVLYCNPFLASLLGAPLETVLGRSLSPFLDEPTDAYFAGLRRAAAEGVSRGEIAFRGPQGLVLTQVSITVLKRQAGFVHCLIVTVLPERKRREEERLLREQERVARASAEDANQKAHVEIARRVGMEESLLRAEMDKTQLLERERILRTEAEDANRLKDEFLATLSHELRTPLSAILTWSHVLRRKALAPDVVARAVDAIDRNARAQSDLVANLLDVSRIVTGKFQMSLGPVRPSDVIQLAAETLRPAAKVKNISLAVRTEPCAALVEGDANRLQQVFWNLLSNAIRLAPSGGNVEVRVQNVGPSVEISVTDDGAGIDPAFLPYLFERFRQGDSSSTRRHAGLGLGLAIVRHLVELHGGSVEARNREDRSGAVFAVRLPRSQEKSAEAAADETSHTEEAPPECTSLDGLSVLLVDNEADALEGLAIMLEDCGARVLTALSARAALVLLLDERPDVLVADIGMPDEDGHALLQSVRLLPVERGGGTPAIALSAYAGTHDGQEALRSGFQMHLAKPATPEVLVNAIGSLARTFRAS